MVDDLVERSRHVTLRPREFPRLRLRRGVEVADLETGERRPSRLSDVAEIARLADALDEVAATYDSMHHGHLHGRAVAIPS